MAKTSIRQTARYEPPRLPDYLSRCYKLKTIIGVPSEDDVMVIHAVIGAVNSVSQIPALNDPSLSMQLTQHLFNAQMAIYRSVYSSGPFQEDHTYAPPTFPSHIPIRLDTVVGPPSDEQIISVHNAVRDLDNLSRVPSMFDPDVSMRLSQHLFNIQIARHIEEASQGRFAPEPSQTRSEASGPEPVSGTLRARFAVDLQKDVSGEGKGEDIQLHESGAGAGEPTNATQTAATTPRPSNQSVSPISAVENTTGITNTPENINSFLRTLQNIDNTLISVQQGLAVAAIRTDFQPIVNRKGELPLKYGLPKLTYDTKKKISGKSSYICMCLYNTDIPLFDHQLVAYLRFYEIGKDLIEVRNGKPMIAENKKEEAEMLLGQHLVTSPGSGWAVSS